MDGSGGLTVDYWTGSWELERRENWGTYLEFLGIPAENREAAERAPDFHRYRVAADAFTMEHRIPAQGMHLLFRADLDGAWHESPYPKPTVAHWAPDAEKTMPTWKNSWLEEPVRFKTEIPNFMGKGKTVTIERHLVSSSQLKMTVHVLDSEAIEVGPCYTYMRKASALGPEPLAWLRARCKPLATAAEREGALEAAYTMVAENIDAISASQEQDRVFPSRFNGVAQMLLAGSRYYQGLVRAWMEPEALEDTCPSMLKAGTEAEWTVINEPKGVCINISPWNAPVQLSIIPMLGMLAAGNHVVIKPPDLVPNVSALLRRLVQKYLNGYVWVEEGGRETVERIIDEAADHLVFTGGGEIAKVVAARCARVLTPVTLELGGKSPVFVDRGLSEEMLDCVVREILQTKVEKTGQFCCAHDYALVHEEAHAAFCAKIGAELEALGERRNVHLVGRRQYEGLKRKLEEAQAGGAECLPPMAGSLVPNDEAMTLPMTCLLDPPPDSGVLQAELFGPLLPVLKVKDVGAAIEMVNVPSRRKPLIAYCYTEDRASADAFIAGTSSGNVAVNSGPQRMISNFSCAFGGVGPSGTGHAMWGRAAMTEFSSQKHVIRAKDGFAKSFFSGPPPAAS